MLRACFFLLAIVLLTEVGLAVFAGAGCFWLILTHRAELGACRDTTTAIREVFSEILAAVLALLLAARK